MRARLRTPAAASAAEASHDPATAALLARLSATAAGLDDRTSLRPEFRTELRQRLLAVAAVHPVDAPEEPDPTGVRAVLAELRRRSPVGRAGRRLALGLAAVAVAATATGLGMATSSSLPGDPLYVAKRATESLQLQTAGNDLEKGQRHLQFAATRLREVERLAGRTDSMGVTAGSGGIAVAGAPAAGGSTAERIADALDTFASETRTGVRLVEDAAVENADAALLRQLQVWTDKQGAKLRSLVPELPSTVRAHAESTLTLIHELGNGAGELVAEVCAPAAGRVPARSCAESGTPTPAPPGSGQVGGSPTPSGSSSALPLPVDPTDGDPGAVAPTIGPPAQPQSPAASAPPAPEPTATASSTTPTTPTPSLPNPPESPHPEVTTPAGSSSPPSPTVVPTESSPTEDTPTENTTAVPTVQESTTPSPPASGDPTH